jgi:hypothetical protein
MLIVFSKNMDVRWMRLSRGGCSNAMQVPHISSQLAMHQESLLTKRYKHLVTAHENSESDWEVTTRT